jgi:anti-sigma regulatory factor (Ser/Thr protein kinase)/DNA-directed RNA polymerase subunit RPC12/RpoP
MPYYSCPNCGSSVSSAVGTEPGACPRCCARLQLTEQVPSAEARRALRSRRPTPVVKVPIRSARSSPAVARHALHELSGELGASRMRVCELLASELVTNVVQHVETPAEADMRVRLYGDCVRVEVRDEGPGFTPALQPLDEDTSAGWGLHLVQELADDWGVELGAQTCVWFELGRTPVASGSHAVAHP